MCKTKYLNKYIATFCKIFKLFLMQNISENFLSVWKWCFTVNYNFIIVITEQK